jgi:HSP20 family protein
MFGSERFRIGQRRFVMLRSPLFPELVSVQNTLDRLVNSTFGDQRQSRDVSANGRTVPVPMPIDVYGTDEHVVILAEVPGMHADDLDLTVNQNTITLSGSIRGASESEDAGQATWYVSELARGTYRRSITLPFEVDADKAEARMDSGILRVTLPKAEANRPRKISISTSKGSTKEVTAKSTTNGQSKS